MRVNVSVLTISLCLGLLQAARSDANFGCEIGDNGWGVTATTAETDTPGAIIIAARTSVAHGFDHPWCDGVMWAKPSLIGLISGQCTTLQGLNHTSAATSDKTTSVTCSSLPCGATYHGGGEHWWRDDEEHRFTESSNSYFLQCEQPCSTWNNDESECGAHGCYYWIESNECREDPTPILINLTSNGAVDHLTSAADGVVFDISGTGVPQQVGWTEPDSEVAFLAMDRNGNGAIDSGSELFGNATRKRDGSLAAHGFDALLDLDGGASASDGAITPTDDAYARLAVWLDRNHNGYSEADEVLSLPQAGIVAIYTDFKGDRREDRYGNVYALAGQALIQKNGQQLLRRVFDVLLTTK